MSRQETINTRHGEMLDMISCLAIYNGSAKPQEQEKVWTFEEAILLK